MSLLGVTLKILWTGRLNRMALFQVPDCQRAYITVVGACNLKDPNITTKVVSVKP
jgi:hypothetical protein